MLTKRQALEFIYNISQYSRKVNLIMFSGILEVDYFEDKREQERFLKEVQNRWQRLMNTCKGLK